VLNLELGLRKERGKEIIDPSRSLVPDFRRGRGGGGRLVGAEKPRDECVGSGGGEPFRSKVVCEEDGRRVERTGEEILEPLCDNRPEAELDAPSITCDFGILGDGKLSTSDIDVDIDANEWTRCREKPTSLSSEP
jgi:hypothetical protein